MSFSWTPKKKNILGVLFKKKIDDVITSNQQNKPEDAQIKIRVAVSENVQEIFSIPQ